MSGSGLMVVWEVDGAGPAASLDGKNIVGGISVGLMAVTVGDAGEALVSSRIPPSFIFLKFVLCDLVAGLLFFWMSSKRLS